MQAALTSMRAVQFAAAIVLFGQFAFAYVAPGRGHPRSGFLASAAWAALALALSAIGWLLLEASSMSGQPLQEAIAAGTWRTVLAQTFFGHAFIVRAVLFGIACIALGRLRRGHARAWYAVGTIAALLLLAMLACMGHAAGGSAAERVPHIAADAVHLVAAGAWLGCLLPLVVLLRDAASAQQGGALGFAALAVRRFSALGIASVGALVLTGTVNACYTVHTWDGLVESRYGLELVLKVALFGVMVVLAAVNRQLLVPRIESANAGPAALRKLLRNAQAEVVLGFAIVAIVAQLGITPPPMTGMHEGRAHRVVPASAE